MRLAGTGVQRGHLVAKFQDEKDTTQVPPHNPLEAGRACGTAFGSDGG